MAGSFGAALKKYPLLAGLGLLLLCLSGAASALDYRSVGADRVILYDGPSAQARRVFVVGKFYPVEIVVSLEQWAKVRDSSGGLAWIEKKQLSDARMVVVTAARADIRQTAGRDAPLVFQAERDVVLELIEADVAGWLKVRHRDGQAGYVLASQVWGA